MPVRKDAEGRYHAEVCIDRRRLHRRLPLGASKANANRVEAELTGALHARRVDRLSSIPGDPLRTDLLGDYSERHTKTLRSTDTAQYHADRIGRWCDGRLPSETLQVATGAIHGRAGHHCVARRSSRSGGRCQSCNEAL